MLNYTTSNRGDVQQKVKASPVTFLDRTLAPARYKAFIGISCGKSALCGEDTSRGEDASPGKAAPRGERADPGQVLRGLYEAQAE